MNIWDLIALAKASNAGINVDSPLTWRDTVPTFDDLPSGAEDGDTYRVLADGNLYAYANGTWGNLGAVIAVDSSIDGASVNPVQNKAINAAMTGTAEANAKYHLGFYLDANGDLCQVDDE